MKIVCISGYSGSGKTTMINFMKKYLPNAYFITKDEADIRIIKNPGEMERIYGVPVDTDQITRYFNSVVAFRNGIDIKEMSSDLKYQAQLWQLLSPYVEQKYDELLRDILSKTTPDIVVVESSSVTRFKIWKEADYRIIVRPSNWELLIEKVLQRPGRRPMSREAVIARNKFTKAELIDKAENVTFEIINNYDESFETTIKDFCDKLGKECS